MSQDTDKQGDRWALKPLLSIGQLRKSTHQGKHTLCKLEVRQMQGSVKLSTSETFLAMAVL